MQQLDFAQIVCPECAKEGRTTEEGYPVVIDATGRENVRCDVCQHRFRALTRQVAALREHTLDDGRVRYELHTVEGEGGRVRPRLFTAQPYIHLPVGHWVTLVWEGNRLVGIAEQTTNDWYAIVSPITGPEGLSRWWKAFLAVLALVVCGQLFRVVEQAGDLVDEHGTHVLPAALLVLFVLVAPVLMWAVRTARGQ